MRVGPGRLKLGVETDTRYDSRVGTGIFGGQFGPDPNNPNPADAIARGRGVLDLNVPGTRYKVQARGGLEWNQYLGLVTGTQPLSFFGADLDARAVLNPHGKVALELSENFIRSDRTFNPLFGLGVIGLHNDAKARMRFKPGGGALELGTFYEFRADVYTPQVRPLIAGGTGRCLEQDSCNPDLAAAFNAFTHRVGADARWRFLPKTGLILEADYGSRSYPYEREFVANTPTRPLRAMAGIGTLLSSRWSFLLKGGYMGLFFNEEEDLPTWHDWIGQAEVGLRLTETFHSRLGVRRGLEPVGGAAIFFGENRLYWDFNAQFSRMVVTAQASANLIGFGRVPRTDLNVVAALRLEYHATRWLRLTAMAASFNRFAGVADTQETAFSFNREEISVGLATLF